jgi:hypothetical protein
MADKKIDGILKLSSIVEADEVFGSHGSNLLHGIRCKSSTKDEQFCVALLRLKSAP